jgi:hypothetical protein
MRSLASWRCCLLFQRIAGIADFADRTNIAGVRLTAPVPREVPDPPRTYYRNALDGDRAVFTHLNGTTMYSVMRRDRP